MNSESTQGNGDRKPVGRAWVVETVRRIQRGEHPHEHFELLFREYEPAIRHHLQKRGWHGADLDDLVQEVMVRVYRGIGKFRLDSSLSTWILQTMSNASNNAIRDHNTGKARVNRVSLDSLLEKRGGSAAAMAEPQATTEDPLDGALASERKARLATALDRLPARVRQCLLFRYQGLKYREIADAQGVTIATVKKQISQGHRRLRPILGPFVELFGLLLTLLVPR